MNQKNIIGLALAGAIATSAAVMAAVTFDPGTGNGFVGKGDVQLVYGWNNKALNDNASSVQFRAEKTEVTEVSWVCTNDKNEHTQERERTTSTSFEGVVSHITRDNKRQITGFTLTGYSGAPTQTSSSEGPPLNSCPSGPWALTTPAGEPEVVSTTGGLQVSNDGVTWFTILAF